MLSLGRRTGLRACAAGCALRDTGRQYLDNTGDDDRTIDPWTTVDLSLWFDLGELGLRVPGRGHAPFSM